MDFAHLLKLLIQGLGPVVSLALGHPVLALIAAACVLAGKLVTSIAKPVNSIVWEEALKGYVADSVAMWDDRFRARTGRPSRADSPWHRRQREGQR